MAFSYCAYKQQSNTTPKGIIKEDSVEQPPFEGYKTSKILIPINGLQF